MDSGDESEEYLSGGTNGCVLLIDVSPPMWECIEGERPIDILLSSCINLVKKMMINSPTQLIGISLFGTVEDDNQGIKNVKQLIPLKEPSVEDVKCLEEFLTRNWGVTGDFSLADALWQASRMFSGCRKKMSAQTITVLSALQPPDPTSHKVILKKASDIRELNISVNIVNVSSVEISADSFFMELGKVICDQPNMDWEPPEPMLDANDILTLIWTNNHRKRASAILKMYLGPDVVLGVGMYSLSTKRTPPKKLKLHRDSNGIVVASSSWKAVPRDGQQDGEDNENEDSWDTPRTNPQSVPILKADLNYVAEYGERRVVMTSEEHDELNNFAGPPCIKVLGFKSSSILNMSEWYLKPSSFIYPNDQLVEGSSQLFLALRDRCLALDRVAICLLISRRFSLARFVALVPQKRVVKGNCHDQPDGFHVIYLPYSDDFKELPLEVGSNATVEQLTCMENILNKLKFHFKGDMFENPTLQTMYRAIEALALDEASPQEIEDTTLPYVDKQSNRLGPLQEDFQSLFGSMNISAVKRTKNSSKSNKRVAGGGAEDGEMMDPAMVVARINNSNIDKYTVPQLKLILKNHNIPNLPGLSGMKKDQLVQTVYDNSSIILAHNTKTG